MALIFSHQNVPVVIGLTWVPLAGAEGVSTKHELRDAVESTDERNATQGVLLETVEGRAYGGILPSNAPAGAARAYSGAGWLAQSVPDRVLLVDLVRAGSDPIWWVVAASPGAVDLSTDRLLREDQATELIDRILFDAYHSAVVVRVVIQGRPPASDHLAQLPLEADLPIEEHSRKSRRVEGTFADLVGDDPPDKLVRMRQIKGVSRSLILVVVVAGIVLALAAGALQWRKHVQASAELAKHQADAERKRLSSQALIDMRDVRIAEAVAKALVADTATPRPASILTGCADIAAQVGAVAVGWKVETITCEPGKPARIAWARTYGTNSALVAWAKHRNIHEILVAANGAAIIMTVPLTPGSARPAMLPPDLPDAQGVIWFHGTQLQQFEHGFESTASLSEAVPKDISYQTPDDTKQRLPVPTDKSYLVGKVTITGSGLYQMRQVPLDYPYFTVTKVLLTVREAAVKYNLEGIYVAQN